MIHEDFLMLQRAVLASDGHISCRLLRASVYNSPALDVMDRVQQMFRWIIHGWMALGFVFSNLGRLKRAPLMLALFACSVLMFVGFSVVGPLVPIISLLNTPTALWSP